MLNSIIGYLGQISSYSVLIPLLIGILNIRTLTLRSRVLFFYIVVSTFVEFYVSYLSNKGINTMFLSHIFVVIEFSFFAFIFCKLLKYSNNIYFFLLLILLSIGLIDLIYLSGIEQKNVLTNNSECLILICLSILYFSKAIRKSIDLNLTQSFEFWYTSAVLIYSSGAFFIFLFANVMVKKSVETYFALYGIHSIFNITFNSLLAVALTKKSYGN